MDRILILLMLSLIFIVSKSTGVEAQSNADRNRIILYAASAEKALSNSNWDEALDFVEKMENILGSKAARFEAIKLQAHYGNEDYILAKRSLDTFLNMTPNPELLRKIGDYVDKIETAVKIEQDRLERLRQQANRFNRLVSEADAALNQSNLTEAERLYEEALSIKSGETYPKNQLEKIEQEKARLKKEADQERARLKREADKRRLQNKIDAIDVLKEGLAIGLKHQKRFSVNAPTRSTEVSTSDIIKSKKLFSNSNRVYFTDKVQLGVYEPTVTTVSSVLTLRFFVQSYDCEYQYGNTNGTAVDVKLTPTKFSSSGVSFSIENEYYLNKYVHGCREKGYQNREIGDLSGQVLSFMKDWANTYKSSKGTYISFTNDEQLAYEKDPIEFKKYYIQQFSSSDKLTDNSVRALNKIVEDKNAKIGGNLSSLSEYKGKWLVSFESNSLGQSLMKRSSLESIKDGLAQQKDDNRYLSDLEYGEGTWHATFNSGYSGETKIVEGSTPEELIKQVKVLYNSYYSLVDTEYASGKWYGVMVKGGLPANGYAYSGTYDGISDYIKKRYSDGYDLISFEYGDGVYFTLYLKQNPSLLSWKHSSSTSSLDSFIKDYNEKGYGILSMTPTNDNKIFALASKSSSSNVITYKLYNSLTELYDEVKPEWYDNGFVIKNVEFMK